MQAEPSAEVGRAPRYRAFISYSSADRTTGEAFHAAIERFRVPKPLRGRQTARGPVSKSLAPVFRDRSDADASQNLSALLLDALAASEALIVLCSPLAAQSKWVNREISEFKRLRPGAPVLPVIVAGRSGRYDPALRPDGAFPPALYDRVGPDGQMLVGADPEPLAPDWRKTGDGPHFTVLKIAAALTGIRLTELTQRQAEAERRERNIARGIAAGMTVLALVAVAGGVLAWIGMDAARKRLSDVVDMAAAQVQDAADIRDSYGVPSAVIRDLLDKSGTRLNAIVAKAKVDTPQMRLSRAGLAQAYAQYAADEAPTQERQARAALAGLDALDRPSLPYRLAHLLDAPTDPRARAELRQDALRTLAVALSVQPGKMAEAEAVMRQALEASAPMAPDDRGPQTAENYRTLAQIRYQRSGDLAKALEAQDKALAALKDQREGQDPEVDYQIAALRSDRAETLLEFQRIPEALGEQERAVALLRRVAARDPGDTHFAVALAATLGRVADVRATALNDGPGSLPVYEEALAMQERLHAGDPLRTDYIQDLTATLERIVDVLVEAPRQDLARITALQDRVVALRRSLVARDASDAGLRRDLAVALERAGDVAVERHDLGAARRAYDESFALRSALRAEPANRGEARLVASHDYAQALIRQGGFAALTGRPLTEIEPRYRAAIAEMTPYLRDPQFSPQWRFEVASWELALADVLAKRGRPADALALRRAAAGRLDALAAEYPDQPMYDQWRKGVRQLLGAEFRGTQAKEG